MTMREHYSSFIIARRGIRGGSFTLLGLFGDAEQYRANHSW